MRHPVAWPPPEKFLPSVSERKFSVVGTCSHRITPGSECGLLIQIPFRRKRAVRLKIQGEKAIRVLVADDTRIHTQLLADALRRDRQLEVISPPVDPATWSKPSSCTGSMSWCSVPTSTTNPCADSSSCANYAHPIPTFSPSCCWILPSGSHGLQAFRAGARGIFSRHDSVETLSKCIRSVYQGQIWANSEQMSFAVEALATSPVVRAVDANGLSLLSKREMDVVRSLAEGLTNREIAERLGLSQHTIKNYLFRVYDKLGVSSRLELLFMTLTQAGTPQLTVRAGASGNRHRVQRPSRLDIAAKVSRPELANNAEGPELPFHEPDEPGTGGSE